VKILNCCYVVVVVVVVVRAGGVASSRPLIHCTKSTTVRWLLATTYGTSTVW
jgi:hypothetical protein